MTFRSLSALLAIVILALAGCAQPRPVVFDPKSANPSRIGVAMTAVPPSDTWFRNTCGLCPVVANPTNSALTAYARTLVAVDLPALKERFAEQLRARKNDVVVIAENIDFDSFADTEKKGTDLAKKDFSSLRDKYKLDKLLVINVLSTGFIRSYSSYFPRGDPKASVNITGSLIDLKTNRYEWHWALPVYQASEGPWDEPPNFPGLTSAYHQAIKHSMDNLLKPFAD